MKGNDLPYEYAVPCYSFHNCTTTTCFNLFLTLTCFLSQEFAEYHLLSPFTVKMKWPLVDYSISSLVH